ncbi:MAG TPA: fumarylacetoacetate hydrolase, partial [Verrucomicrobiae bacterium]|nr:fumarylacetoacetate hydrolase [Verrucomicrobiae bacterium]
MKICRFKSELSEPRIGLAGDNNTIRDLTPAGITQLTHLLEEEDPLAKLKHIAAGKLPVASGRIIFCPPVDRQEVWAAGVTYLRSKTARMEESDFSASAYDKVYAAARPEIFFKALPEKVVAHGEPVGIRQDAKWNVPEPELALVFNS